MGDLISRKALIEDLMNLEVVGGHKMYRKGCDHTLHGLVPEMINAQPAVDAVILPCKLGDTVYIAGDRFPAEICGIRIGKDGTFFEYAEYDRGYELTELWDDGEFQAEDIGKTVFLTREEAEAALAKMGG